MTTTPQPSSEQELLREKWAAVVGFEGRYEVSTFGQVRSLMRFRGEHGWVANQQPRTLKPNASRLYLRICLRSSAGKRDWCIHRLVLGAFVGACPAGHVGRHLDGNRYNNRLSNLAYGTRDENEADKIVHGTLMAGEKNGNSKLNVRDIESIRQRHKLGESYGSIGRAFGVADNTARSIVIRKAWKHVG